MTVPFGELVEFAIGGGWGSDDGGEVPVTVIRGTDFAAAKHSDLAGCPRRFETRKRADRRAVRAGDILLEISGGSKASGQTTGRSLLVTEKIASNADTVIPASFCRLLRLNRQTADPQYVYYHLQEMYQSGRAGRYENQSTGISNFQFKYFLEQERIRLPPLPEQRQIAHVLGSLDAKIESNLRIAKRLEQITVALFKARFVDFAYHDDLMESEAGPIPKDWELGAVSDMCESRYGYTASATAEQVGPKFLRVMDINKQPWISWKSVPHCEIDDDKKEKFGLALGDLVVARMADPGKVALIEEDVDAVAASYLVRLRADSLAKAYYLFGFLRSSAYVNYCQATMAGSVQKNMNARVITAAKLPLPPPAEMTAHLQLVLPIRHRLIALLRESSTLGEIRDALLPRLTSGQVRVPAGTGPGGEDV